jgi:hypothetical protein
LTDEVREDGIWPFSLAGFSGEKMHGFFQNP